MPKLNHNWHQRYLQEHDHQIGDKLAAHIAHGMGSWKFIIIQSIIVGVWILMNISAWVYTWDEYPFILLNFLFSTQAAFAAPIIMMSQNREVARDRVQAEHDYEVNENSLKLISVNTNLTEEIHKLTLEIHALTRDVHQLLKAHQKK